MPEALELDELDRAVLHHLQVDGRRSFRHIAREIGASEATVRFRVNRLRDGGVVRILGFVVPSVLGYGVLSSLLVRVQPSHVDQVVEAVTEWQEAMYVSSTVGRTDLFVQVVCQNHEALFEMVSTRLGELPGILSVETLVEVKVHKAHYVYSGLG